jgi:hypothetical protein
MINLNNYQVKKQQNSKLDKKFLISLFKTLEEFIKQYTIERKGEYIMQILEKYIPDPSQYTN